MGLTAGIVGLPNVGSPLYLMQLHKQEQNLRTIHSVQLIQT